jgi:hypothetical protein
MKKDLFTLIIQGGLTAKRLKTAKLDGRIAKLIGQSQLLILTILIRGLSRILQLGALE